MCLQADCGEAASHPAQPGAGVHARPVRGVLAAGQHPQPRRGSRPAPQVMEVGQQLGFQPFLVVA